MSSITYDRIAAERGGTAPATAHKGWFGRLIARFMANRQRQAMEHIRRHAVLLPHELEQAGWKITERSEDSLPFRR